MGSDCMALVVGLRGVHPFERFLPDGDRSREMCPGGQFRRASICRAGYGMKPGCKGIRQVTTAERENTIHAGADKGETLRRIVEGRDTGVPQHHDVLFVRIKII